MCRSMDQHTTKLQIACATYDTISFMGTADTARTRRLRPFSVNGFPDLAVSQFLTITLTVFLETLGTTRRSIIVVSQEEEDVEVSY